MDTGIRVAFICIITVVSSVARFTGTCVFVSHIRALTMDTGHGVTLIYLSLTVNSSVAMVTVTTVAVNVVRAVTMDTGH